MKKILVLFALLMTGVMGIHAQEGLKWGAMAGMNSSKFSTDGFDSKVGFHVGIKAEKDLPQIAQGVYLDMAALLSLKGTQINGNDASLKFNPYYLEYLYTWATTMPSMTILPSLAISVLTLQSVSSVK